MQIPDCKNWTNITQIPVGSVKTVFEIKPRFMKPCSDTMLNNSK
jgi:hypothetical protein